MLRDEVHYVQSIAKNNLSALLSSGFTAIDRNTAQSPLPKPLIKAVLNQSSGELWLRVKRVPNARNYQVRRKVGEGEWMDDGIHSQTRKIVVPDLTPGIVYTIQVRALGGSTGYSEWSMAKSKMATGTIQPEFSAKSARFNGKNPNGRSPEPSPADPVISSQTHRG
jgi:hypothetical protein